MSALPKLPPNWRKRPLRNVCEIIMGQAPKGTSYNDKGIGTALIAGAADLGLNTPEPKKWTDSPTKIGKKGDIIICVRATIGNLNWADKEYCYGRGVAGIRSNSKFNPDFIWFWLMACREHLLSLGRGATFKQISKSDIASLPVPDLEMAEQRRIVAQIKECTERVGEIERLRSEVLEEAENIAPSLYAAMENGDRWPKRHIGDLVEKTRNGKSIRQDNEKCTGHVLSLSAVHDVSLNLKERKPIVLPDNIAEQYKISKGDVFVSRSNTRELVGLISVARETPKRTIYPDLLIKLNPKKDIIRSRYLAYALRTPESRQQIKDRAVGTSQSMVKISGQRLKEVEIPLPPLDVQDSLISKFDELHDLSSDLLIDLKSFNSDALRQSILRKAFAGEL